VLSPDLLSRYFNLPPKFWTPQRSMIELTGRVDISKLKELFESRAAAQPEGRDQPLSETEVLALEGFEPSFIEGHQKLVDEHLARERSAVLVKLKKRLVLEREGNWPAKCVGSILLPATEKLVSAL
jgi:hypothetical protein